MKEKSSFNCSFSFPLICLHFNNNRLIIRTGLLNSPWHTPAWSFSPGQRWCGLPETHHGKSHWPKKNKRVFISQRTIHFPHKYHFLRYLHHCCHFTPPIVSIMAFYLPLMSGRERETSHSLQSTPWVTIITNLSKRYFVVLWVSRRIQRERCFCIMFFDLNLSVHLNISACSLCTHE